MYSEKLEEYFYRQENVILRLHFWINSQGLRGEETDLDVAVYQKDENDEDRIWLDLCNLTEKEVHLIFLNKAPASIVPNIFKNRFPFVIR